jgi:hypothetical protein
MASVPDEETYADGMATQNMSGTVIPRARKGKDSSGFVFDTLAPIRQFVVDGDVVKPLSPEKILQLRANRIQPGAKGADIMSYDELLKDTPPLSAEEVREAKSEFVPLGAPKAPAPAPLVAPKVEPAGSSQPAAPRTKVKFVSRMGKLTVPFHEVFKSDLQPVPLLVLVQRGEEGSFYEAPSDSEERLEVYWNGEVLVCLPGVHFVFPDGLMAVTVLLVDRAETEARKADADAERERTEARDHRV